MLNVEIVSFNLKLLTNVETGVKSGTVWWREMSRQIRFLPIILTNWER